MTKNHIKRMSAPKTWPIGRKQTKWMAKPLPGPHPLSRSLTLNFILIDLLKYTKTTKEVKKVLNEGKILVDNKVRKEEKFAVGLFDVISIPEMNEHFRLLINKKGKLFLHQIKKEEATIKPRKIIGKTTLKNKKTQINFYDGSNKIIDNKDYKVGDTLFFNLIKNDVKEAVKLEKEGIIFITSGKQVGNIGEIKNIKQFKSSQAPIITFTRGKEEFETLKEYAFVIGKSKPLISLPQEK